MPPIQKMDATLGGLVKCQHLSLGSNQIDKIAGLQGLAKLKVLSLGRNNIKKIEGLEPVAETLEELWMSYNLIEKVNGIECCKKLKIAYLANNKIKDWAGIDKLRELPALEDLLLLGNPLQESLPEQQYYDEVAKRFPKLKKLDGRPIVRPDEDAPPAAAAAAADKPAA